MLSTVLILSHCSSSRETISYNEQIRPIINSKCIACHGGVKKSGELSFLFREEAIATGASGKKSIVPGKPNQSEVIKRLTHENPEVRMPLDHAPLDQAEIDLLRQWIKEGAKWEKHWAYIPLKEPVIPDQLDPWANNAIDHYVMKKFTELGLSPTGVAAPEVLLRRMFLDITGLPPTESDYEKYLPADELPLDDIIDELLVDSAYGEKWASFWLDLARYADSQGL